MKKKALFIIAIFVLCLTLFVACNKKAVEEKSSICRSVDCVYIGESEAFALSVECGSREKVFIADGVATDVLPFAELSVTPLVAHDYTTMDFVINGEGATLSGSLTADNFGEFRQELSLEFKPLSVTLKIGETSQTIDVQNVLEGKLTSADVINIAKTEFAERISADTAENGELKREIYVKLISGDRENFYYYVSFIGEGVDYWALLINPETGEVVSKK